MKTYKNLFGKIVEFDNLLLAARNAQKGKRFKENVLKFNFQLEKELLQLKQELEDGKYLPGKYKEFFITEPKKRMISAAPYRDRVVHHALMNVIGEIFEKTFIYDSYANRKLKGTHKAILRFTEYSRKNKYVLKCDIKKYFPSIDLEILKILIRRKIACPKTLQLIDLIIDNSNKQEDVIDYFSGDDLFTPFERKKGLPIGNLTSQYFANIYLNGLDQYIKNELQMKCYLRYVDDFVIFSDTKEELKIIKSSVEKFLEKLRLKLNSNKSLVYKTRNGVEYLGHKVFPYFRLLKKQNKVRFKRKIKKMLVGVKTGEIDKEKLKRSINSWEAHAKFSNTYRLRTKILKEVYFN